MAAVIMRERLADRNAWSGQAVAWRGPSPRIIAGACGSTRAGRPGMALDTTQERVRPVTGTHVVRVQHEGLATADAERSKDFYCRVLGFQVLPRPAFTSGGYWLGTPGIFPQIHIIQSAVVPPGPTAPISPLARHTCFEVADYE